MKKLLIALLLTINITLYGATYYVATNGNDSNPGTLAQPFASWQKAFDVVQAGDIVYIRGGTYYPVGSGLGHGYYGAIANRKSGTADNMIKIFNYPGEKPILDCRNLAAGTRFGIFLFYSHYWHLKGLNVTRVDQTNPDGSSDGIMVQFSNHNIIEQCNSFGNGGTGIVIHSESEDNLVLNCDSYYNYDPYTLANGVPYPGDNADGFAALYITERIGNEKINTFRGCRAWDNGDDGFDFYDGDGILITDRCWAWHNGVIPGTNNKAGNSNGFKFGQLTATSSRTDYLRVVTNCIAFNHRQIGFTQQECDGNILLYNNISYKNVSQGYEFGTYARADLLRNNISFGNGQDVFQSSQRHDHNSWDISYTVTSSDFVSFDETQLSLPRKEDGSLPDISFLHLSQNSGLIDAGTDVGIPYNGSAPDLGAFEFQNSAPPPPPVPVFTGAAVENATPSRIDLTYNLSLANVLPAASAFSVMVNSAARSVSSVAVSGTKVYLTLSAPVAYGNTVTVAYSKPASNPLQTSAGGQAATFGAQNVTNRVSQVVAPPPPNTPPVVVVNYQKTAYSGFESSLNATGSYDPNNDQLTFTWIIPSGVPVSSAAGPVISYLAPVVETARKVDFTLRVSDGKTTQSQVISVDLLPYQPELTVAEIGNVESSGFQTPYYTQNILDGDIGTMWSADGDEQWVILDLKKPFNIQHIKLAFMPGQKYEAYFDVLGSEDRVNWELILSKSKSCAFSGNLQVFDFPASKTEREFRFVKIVGHGNSVNTWNYISEFRIFGHTLGNPSYYENQAVKIYPNPVIDFINIRIDDPAVNIDFLRIVNLAGKIVLENIINPETREFRTALNLMRGIYIVQMGVGKLTLFTQKIIVSR